MRENAQNGKSSTRSEGENEETEEGGEKSRTDRNGDMESKRMGTIRGRARGEVERVRSASESDVDGEEEE
jgi:hypothetical protein